MKLAIVTATTNPHRAQSCILSWNDVKTFIVVNGRQWTPIHAESTELEAEWISVHHTYTKTEAPSYIGTVPAFRLGVDTVLAESDAEIIACLHDDFEIREPNWDTKVIRHFQRHPRCGLLGFGGAIGLGDSDLYQKPYEPKQLARIGFRSNLEDAEVHGMRSLLPEPVACLDGFSQIGRREFWLGQGLNPNLDNARDPDRYGGLRQWDRPWTYLESLGIVHHMYDGALGCLARRYGWETWYLPLRAKHWGGQTAVGDAGYQDWAKTQVEGGDHGFWEHAHKTAYEAFRDVLPLRA